MKPGWSFTGRVAASIILLTLGSACESKQETAKEHFKQGWVYAEKGFWDEALSEFKNAVRLDPIDAKAHHSLGVAYARKNMWDLALDEFKEAMRLEPELPQSHYGLGAAYVRKGDRQSALEQYRWLKGTAPLLADRLLKRIDGKWSDDSNESVHP